MLPLTCSLHLRNCFLSLACLMCSLTNLSSYECQLSKRAKEKPGGIKKKMNLDQHHQELSPYSSYVMARHLRRKVLFSVAAKPLSILTPGSLNPCRPAPVNISQPSSLINWAVSTAEKYICLWRHSWNHRMFRLGRTFSRSSNPAIPRPSSH